MVQGLPEKQRWYQKSLTCVAKQDIPERSNPSYALPCILRAKSFQSVRIDKLEWAQKVRQALSFAYILLSRLCSCRNASNIIDRITVQRTWHTANLRTVNEVKSDNCAATARNNPSEYKCVWIECRPCTDPAVWRRRVHIEIP